MPSRRGKSGARRRETQLPEIAYVNNDRRRGRSPKRRMEQLGEESSVIMLCSAENSLMPVGDNKDDSFVLMTSMNETRRSAGRRSTRLTDVDMMVDETRTSMQSRCSRSFQTDGTNMSIINVDQTTMIERDRPKSSVLSRWTRSKSMAPPGVAEAVEGIRRSSIFSMVTKRKGRRARSTVRNSTQDEAVPSRSTVERKEDAGQGMDLSQISEEQANATVTGSVAGTPKPLTKELVIQTRSMLKKGKRWSPIRTKARSASRGAKNVAPSPKKAQLDEPPKEINNDKASNTQNRKGINRQRNQPNAEASKENPVPVYEEEAPSNEKTSLVPAVSRRKRREPAIAISGEEPVVDANQNVSSVSKNGPQLEQPVQSQNLEVSERSMESSSDQSKSNPCDNSQFSNVSKRKRPKPPEPSKEATTSEKNIRGITCPMSVDQLLQKPEPAMKRLRTRSVSRHPELSKQRTTSEKNLQETASAVPVDHLLQEPKPVVKRSRTRSVSRGRQPALKKLSVAAQEPEQAPQSGRRGRSRKRAISESTTGTPIKPIVTRSRSKSALRTEIRKSKSPSSVKSRTAKPVPPNATTASRSKSVPRNVLLSPSVSQPTHSADHVPVYQRYAEQVLQLNQSVQELPRPEPIPPSGGDVYMFDSPSQGSTASSSDDNTKRPKGSTAKKRPRLATNVSSRSRKTPIKKAHHTTVFGTDMGKICRLVKKIGGGPVRRVEDGGTPAAQDVVHTSKLAAMLQPLQSSNVQNVAPRSPSPAVSTHEMAADDHHDHDDHGFDVENIPEVELPTPLSPPRINPQMQRVLQQKGQHQPTVNTPDKTQPNSTLSFSPQASSSPWRFPNENILPKTFYFSRSKDMLPSYESDLVFRDEGVQPKSTAQDIPPPTAPAPPRRTSPSHQHSFVRPTAVPPATSPAVFKDIQKSYEQLKATSEMSEKLISAMRKYKSNVHDQTASLGDETSAEELITKFREYEKNMKNTYQKLKQWFERSQRTFAKSMKAIEQASSVPKTQTQREVVDNFRRNSEQFVTMINDLESAMNDSNIENISPLKPMESSGRPPFKDIILTERNRNDQNRSPLKSLNIANVPSRFSPIKSPMVKASLTSFSGNRTIVQSRSKDRFSKLSLVRPIPVSSETETSIAEPAPASEKSVIEIYDTVLEDHPVLNETEKQQPEKDLFGFETDEEQEDEEAEVQPVDPTPVKITRETLKERLQSVRKLLSAPGRIGAGSASISTTTQQQQQQQHVPKIFNSPQRKRLQSIQNAFSSSTPLADKQNQSERLAEQVEPEPNISAIGAPSGPTVEQEGAAGAKRKQESPPAPVFFDEPEQEFASTALASVNRTYSRAPRKVVKPKRNIYLAKLGLSDDEGEEEEVEVLNSTDSDWTEPVKGKRSKKQQKRQQKAKRKKKPVEQSAEFQNFVSEFNSMCDQVNRYELVIEKPTDQQQV